jgi:hypothetical protein
MGAFRFRCVADDDEEADYPDDAIDDEDVAAGLRIAMEPIFDADSSVFFDLDAKRQDKADAKRCYVLTSVSRARYLEEHPESVIASSWPKPTSSTYFDWCTPDVIYVAEVYEIEIKGEKLQVYKSQLTDDEIKLDAIDVKDTEYIADLEAQGYIHAREEKRKRRRVHKWTMNGSEITSDDGYIPGRCIPVIPTYGKRWFVDNIERFMGQVRLAKGYATPVEHDDFMACGIEQPHAVRNPAVDPGASRRASSIVG